MKDCNNCKCYIISLLFIFLSCSNDDKTEPEIKEEAPSTIYAFVYNEKDYEIIKENKTWQQAVSFAVERGGYLAEINSSGENAAIFSASVKAEIDKNKTVSAEGGNASYLWIGGNDVSNEGRWIWDGDNTGSQIHFWQGGVSGEAIDNQFNKWGNEPDNFDGNQNHLALALTEWPKDSGTLGTTQQWNDLANGNALYFVIEYD